MRENRKQNGAGAGWAFVRMLMPGVLPKSHKPKPDTPSDIPGVDTQPTLLPVHRGRPKLPGDPVDRQRKRMAAYVARMKAENPDLLRARWRAASDRYRSKHAKPTPQAPEASP